MNDKVKEENCIMCKAGIVEFYQFNIDNKESILGTCSCGYCCGNEQSLGSIF